MNKSQFILQSISQAIQHQNKKCSWYYQHLKVKKCCGDKNICPLNLPICKVEKLKCCELGGNVIPWCRVLKPNRLNDFYN